MTDAIVKAARDIALAIDANTKAIDELGKDLRNLHKMLADRLIAIRNEIVETRVAD